MSYGSKSGHGYGNQRHRSSGPRIVIAKVGSKEFSKGEKTRLRYPSMNGGYITHTYVSKEAAEADIENLNSWAQRRAKLTKV